MIIYLIFLLFVNVITVHTINDSCNITEEALKQPRKSAFVGDYVSFPVAPNVCLHHNVNFLQGDTPGLITQYIEVPSPNGNLYVDFYNCRRYKNTRIRCNCRASGESLSLLSSDIGMP